MLHPSRASPRLCNSDTDPYDGVWQLSSFFIVNMVSPTIMATRQYTEFLCTVAAESSARPARPVRRRRRSLPPSLPHSLPPSLPLSLMNSLLFTVRFSSTSWRCSERRSDDYHRQKQTARFRDA